MCASPPSFVLSFCSCIVLLAFLLLLCVFFFTRHCLLHFFFFQVEVSPTMTGKALREETITALSVVFPAMGEEPPTGDPAGETQQPMQSSQDSQDPKASRIPSSQSPHLERTPSPIRTVFPQSLSDKGALGDTPLSKQTGKPCFLEIALYLYFLFQFFLSSSFSFSF